MTAENLGKIKEEIKVITLMVLYQAASAGMNILYKFAIMDGMKVKVLVAYRLMFATAFMAPLALVSERKTRPKLTWTIGFQGFLCGVFGTALGNNLFAESMVLTSATSVAAMSNLTPAITFVMAITFRLESLAMKSLSGKAKVFGSALSLGGAMVLTLYKGIQIKLWTTHIIEVPALRRGVEGTSHGHVSGNHVIGSLLALGSCFSGATWLIIQTKLSQRYPCYSSNALMCLMGSIQATVFAISTTERDWSAWTLGWNIRLLTIAYSGIFYSGLMNAAMAWCIGKNGPLYVSSFYPLGLIFTIFLGSFFIDEALHLGSIVGSVGIVIGLYTVLWAKRKETTRIMAQSAAAGDGDEESRISSISRECAVVQISVEDVNQPTSSDIVHINSVHK